MPFQQYIWGGGRAINYDNDDDYDDYVDYDEDNDDFEYYDDVVYSSSQTTSNTIGTRGAAKLLWLWW